MSTAREQPRDDLQVVKNYLGDHIVTGIVWLDVGRDGPRWIPVSVEVEFDVRRTPIALTARVLEGRDRFLWSRQVEHVLAAALDAVQEYTSR